MCVTACVYMCVCASCDVVLCSCAVHTREVERAARRGPCVHYDTLLFLTTSLRRPRVCGELRRPPGTVVHTGVCLYFCGPCPCRVCHMHLSVSLCSPQGLALLQRVPVVWLLGLLHSAFHFRVLSAAEHDVHTTPARTACRLE